ncbi:MAG: tetratricopeptide repeat protein [Elusimicrobiota bacterium]|jgi:tetratricopeptide (TPR) repeat protein
MNNESRLDALDAAREALTESPSRCLALLPAAGELPASLRPEQGFLRAEALRAMGHLSAAADLYEKILPKVDGRQDPVLFMETCLGSASALRSLGRPAQAQERLRKAGRCRWAKNYAEPLRMERALVLRAQGKLESSLRELFSLLRKALRSGELQEAGFLLWAVGGAQRLQGRLEESSESFKKALSLAKRSEDSCGAGYALFGLAGVSRIRGKLKDSERFYRQAAKSFSKTEDLFAKAYANCGLANALRQQGRLQEAERLYARAFVLYSALGDAVDLGFVVWGQGKIALQRGELSKAARLFKRSLSLFENGCEERGAALSETSLAQALYAAGSTEEAELLHASALKRARKAGLHTHLELFT